MPGYGKIKNKAPETAMKNAKANRENMKESPRRLRAKYTHRTTCGYALCISRLHRARCAACGGIWRLPRTSNLFEVAGCAVAKARKHA